MNRESAKILLASFISQAGSHLLTLAISSFILKSTGSVILAAAIYVASYLPAALLASRLGPIIDKNFSKKLLVVNDALGIFSTILCGLIITYKMSSSYLILILSIRSVTLLINRSASLKWLKLVTPLQATAKSIKIYFLIFFLSTAASGFAVGALLTNYEFSTTVIVDVLSYLIAISIYIMLSSVQEKSLAVYKSQVPLPSYLAIFTNNNVFDHFLIVVLSQMFFQGSYSILVSYLPISIFQSSFQGVTDFQLAASLGITVGFIANWLSPTFLGDNFAQLRKVLLVAALGAIGLIVAVHSPNQIFSLSGFYIMNFAFECAWLHSSSAFIKICPMSMASSLQFTLSSTASLLMSIQSLFLAYLLSVSTPLTAIAFSILLPLTMLASFLVIRRMMNTHSVFEALRR